MKVLKIVRHAKSSWDNSNITDFDRPLTKRGTKNAKELATVLDNAHTHIDLIVSSAAVRAKTTANVIAEHYQSNQPKLITEERLYHATVESWMETIQGTSNGFDELMIIGHQPTLSMLTNSLISDPIDHVITSSCSRLLFDTMAWSQVTRHTFHKGVHYNRHDWNGIALK